MKNYKLLYFFYFLFTAILVKAQEPLKLDTNSKLFFPGKYIKIFEDIEGLLSKEDIFNSDWDTQFYQSSSDNIGLGRTSSAYWIKFSVTNPTDKNINLILEESYPHIDDVLLYVYRNEQLIQSAHGGDYFIMQGNEFNYQYFSKELFFPAGSTTSILMRYKTEGNIHVSLKFWKPIAFIEKINRKQWFLGLYFGIMGAMFLYNLFLYLFLRDKNYLYYCLYIGSFSLALLGANRLDIQFLWRDHPVFANIMHPVFYNLTFLFGAMFCRSFLEVKKIDSISNKLLILMQIISLLGIILSFISGYTLGMIPVWYFSGIVGPFILLGAGIRVWTKKQIVARYYTLAWFVFLISAIVFNLRNLGFLPDIPIFEFSSHIGSALEVFLLSLALSDRINIIKNENIETHKQIIETEKKYSTELQKEVSLRTEELALVNKELKKLATIDGLTGLLNRRAFNEIYEQEFYRSSRARTPLSILMIDVDYFKRYNDTYGHQKGDLCLKKVTSQIKNSIWRKSDSVARYGGEEFIVILFKTSRKEARNIAERIRTSVESLSLVHEKSNYRKVTISIGLASFDFKESSTVVDLLKFADDALYKAKENGRNRVEEILNNGV